jgi:hypothetical protein
MNTCSSSIPCQMLVLFYKFISFWHFGILAFWHFGIRHFSIWHFGSKVALTKCFSYKRLITMHQGHRYLREVDCSRHITFQKIHFDKMLAVGRNKTVRLIGQVGQVNRCACFKYQYV